MARRPERPPRERDPNDANFVRRWSRRKEQVRQARQTRVAAPPAATEAAPRVLTDADMPPVESLDASSDFSPFLSPGVSEELRRLALRKLFHLPQFNERCPLDGEYYDCTNLEPLGSIITYDMREEMQRAAEKLAQTVSEKSRPAEAVAATEPVVLPPDKPRDPGAAAATAAPAKAGKHVAARRTRSRTKA
jgi:hypothetical protein